MDRAAKKAHTLLDLLREHVEVQDEWQEHMQDVENGEYADRKTEQDVHMCIQSEMMLPLMEKCAKKGYAYVDLCLMIPGYPKTDYDARAALLADFENFVKETYNGKAV